MAEPATAVQFDELKEERHIEIYETETGVSKTYRMKNLKKQGPPSSMLKVPVQKWTMRADVIVPADPESKKGPVPIASVPIPFSMAVQKSIFGQDKNIYVTPRV